MLRYLQHTFFISLLLSVLCYSAVAADAQTQSTVIDLKKPVSQSGTISFKLHTDKKYFNGQGQADYQQLLVELPGVNKIYFRRTDQVINLVWVWDRDEDIHYAGLMTDFTELPGPQTFFLQYTWNSAGGFAQGYFNGRPLRLPGVRNEAWWVDGQAEKAVVGQGGLKVTDVNITCDYTPADQIAAKVPSEFYGEYASLTGFGKVPEPIDFVGRRGGLIYENLLDSEKAVEGWVKEGPVDVSFKDGCMLMRSADFKEHIVFWCPEDFPESFIAEWEFEPLSYYGLAIVFFAAKGENGEDIFAPSLNERDGRFVNYIFGDILSYHVSYFANIENFQMGRPDSNLRKNNKFYRVGSGPVAIEPGAEGWQHIRLIKDGNRIQLFGNGRICLDWKDQQPERYGKAYGDGKIGFRQMKPTIGRYRNFRLWALEPEDKDNN
ncbi:MAG: DUF1961 family protein [Sedimentisphaeraceae bacterium JB056]